MAHGLFVGQRGELSKIIFSIKIEYSFENNILKNTIRID